jgi:hypothetical protein
MDMYHIKSTLSDITNQVLLCLSEAKPHTDSSVNDTLSLDILNFSSLGYNPMQKFKLKVSQIGVSA